MDGLCDVVVDELGFRAAGGRGLRDRQVGLQVGLEGWVVRQRGGGVPKLSKASRRKTRERGGGGVRKMKLVGE
jgi:hypothetical protein